MSYTKKQFIEDVKAEAIALRQHATKEELERLDIQSFNPGSPTDCIYGQMTFDCQSDRAASLIWDCCTRYIDMPKDDKLYDLPTESFTKMKPYINGEKPHRIDCKEELFAMRNDDHVIRHFSSIEGYILLPNAKIKNLIAYLRGETDTLNL